MLSYLKIYFFQIRALVIKDLKLKARYKIKFLSAVVFPITTFIMPFLVFRKLFETIGDDSFGIWTPENYIIFILSGIFIVILLKLFPAYGKNLLREKYWKTLPGVFLSPVNVFNLLVSKLLSELFIFLIPLIIAFILCFLLSNASLLTIFFVIIIYLCASFFMASIGLAIGSFRMSIEGGYSVFSNMVGFFLIFSCYKYPREFFPSYLEFLIVWNPFYYYWDLIRVMLVLGAENIIFNPAYLLHFTVVLLFTIMAPIMSIMFFSYIYKKYGLVGY
jgi:ABC-type polysaccharide/polyol phosphate export permease